MSSVPEPRRQRSLLISTFLGLLILFALLALLPTRGKVYAKCILLPATQWSLSSRRAGSLEEATVHHVSGHTSNYRVYSFPRDSFLDLKFPNLDFEERNRVHREAGDVVASVVSSDLELEIVERRTALQRAQNNLRILESGAKPEEVTEAEVALETARTALEAHTPEFKRYQALVQLDAVSQSDWQAVEGRHRLLTKEVELASSRLSVLTTGSKPEDVDAARTLVLNLNREIDALKSRKESQNIRAPIDGWLSTGGDEAALLTVDDIDTLVARVLIPQEFGVCPQAGNPVTLRIPGIENELIKGDICRVDRRSMETPAGPVFSAYVVLGNADHFLEVGMQGEAKVGCGETSVLEMLLSGVSRIFRREQWSF